MSKGRRESAAFRRLRFRLTLLCTLGTGLILLGASTAALAVSEGQLGERGEAAFRSEVNAVFYHLRSQNVVDHTWVSQTEAGGGLKLWLELSGKPMLYTGSASERTQELVYLTRSIALQEYALDLSLPPDTRYQDEQDFFRVQDATGQRWRAAVGQVPQDRGWINVIVLQSLDDEENEVLVQRWAFAAFTAAALALLALFAWVFTRRLLRPLEESRRRQSEFIAAASHELRSPLAVVRASLAAMPGAPPEQLRHFTDMADGECVRMSRLVGDMLTLANADSGAWSMCPEETEPETLLLEVYESFESLSRAKGVAMEITLPEKPLPRCRWDPQRVMQLLCVLTDNAVSYTPSGGRVRLAVAQEGERVALTVADSGPGVPDEEKAKIFERFFRGDRARTDREHYGLGLSIAAEIARLHGGTISVSNAPGGGAVFTVTLPAPGCA